MKITIAHSPDSDDAFMFYGLASGAIAAPGLEVDQVLSDIESLNRAAFEGRYEVTAVSFHAYAHLCETYALLPHGASMGDRYGPIVVTRLGGPTSLAGVRWADRTGGLPLPLGNNVIRRDLGMETMRRVASTARTRIASSGCT